MTNSSNPVGVDYARAIAEAAAFLASRERREAAMLGRGAYCAALSPSADIRYPMPALDPSRR